MRRITLSAALATTFLLGAFGCASTAPRELLDARAAYRSAQESRAPELAPAELATARQYLEKAEAAFLDEGDEQPTRDLAYVAERKAQQAMIQARVSEANASKEQADRELVMTATGLAEDRSKALALTSEELQEEQRKRVEAEGRLKDAATRLQAIAAIKEDSRGLVITMPGGVLFESGKFTLLSSAEERLNQVAEALLQNRDANIVVGGHTDSQGAEEFNRELSDNRANAVREYLVARGIAPDRILACGYGEGKPVAGNEKAEGRADNRRVEIVVMKPDLRMACAYER